MHFGEFFGYSELGQIEFHLDKNTETVQFSTENDIEKCVSHCAEMLGFDKSNLMFLLLHRLRVRPRKRLRSRTYQLYHSSHRTSFITKTDTQVHQRKTSHRSQRCICEGTVQSSLSIHCECRTVHSHRVTSMMVRLVF